MKLIKALILAFLVIPGVTRGLGLDWSIPSTNSATISWPSWTNGTPLRYDLYWTAPTNVDTGTNYVTTTNWTMFADVDPSTTSASLTVVPTNSLVTWVVVLPGGKKTVPIQPVTFVWTNPINIVLTNQPLSP